MRFLFYALFILGGLIPLTFYAQERVSMIRILAKPELFYGKNVIVFGFFSYARENDTLYFRKKDYENLIFTNGILLHYPMTTSLKILDKKLNPLSANYVIIQGTITRTRKTSDFWGYAAEMDVENIALAGAPFTLVDLKKSLLTAPQTGENDGTTPHPIRKLGEEK